MENIILEYKLFLQEKKINNTSVKNYLVDARNFIQWFLLYAKTHNLNIAHSPSSLFSYFSDETIADYKSFLQDNNSPVKTINRRLSGLRKLGSFALLHGYISNNPATLVSNVGVKSNTKEAHDNWTHQLVNNFKKDLEKDKVSPNTVKNYISDTNHFLLFIDRII